jgi:A/G-specific adenine glycosylase
MAVVRESDSPVAPARLEAVWADAEQRQRALASLLADGLLVLGSDGDVRLPS